MYIDTEFNMSLKNSDKIRSMTPNFGFNGFGEIVYYRTYSRIMYDEQGEVLGQERWGDTVLRVINGVMSIRKDWYTKAVIHWDEEYWQQYAYKMAKSLFNMNWMPPGRGLWAMGADVIRERGSMALYNCALTEIGENWIDDLCWAMDSLMWGVGVGFRPYRNQLELCQPDRTFEYIIPDTREGWVESLRLLLSAFTDGRMPEFDYSIIRPYGAPIKTFGGTASGPEPLKVMHQKITHLCYRYMQGKLDEVRFKVDLANLVGVCVVSGNVRRSAEIALCEISDPVFMDLKNYNLYPERAEHGWMSNNSVILEKQEDFERLDEVALANVRGYDIGYLNMRNLRKGRIGKNDGLAEDKAIGLNPCGEIPLENREVCNVAETLPTRCVDKDAWLRACEYVTFYCSTVSLLPTHQPSTNAMIAKNRRIGISIVDFTGWKHEEGLASVISHLREGYAVVRATNKRLANEAGVPESNRVTTMKPGGTGPKLPGRTPGASHPTFEYTLRRINVGIGTPIDLVLLAANVPYENSVYTPNTHVFEFPIHQGPARPAEQITVWEQLANVICLQANWSDNAVSNTIYFKPEEAKQLGDLITHAAPYVKSISLLPHSTKGQFAQMPEEGITYDEYIIRLSTIKVIDWSMFGGSDGQDEKFCQGDSCLIPKG